ncbi:MAG TPA: flavin reductase family protein [Acidimicrobiales bacterium]
MNRHDAESPDAIQQILETLHWLTMPVGVVGAARGSERSCATGTLSYVSLRPPMIATSLSRTSRTYELAHRSRHFSISLLRDDQTDVAVLAARRGTTSDKFEELGIDIRERTDVPALADCGAVLWCSIEQECPVGDYVLCIGRVEEAVDGDRGAGPLVRLGGRYHAMGKELDVADESSYPL